MKDEKKQAGESFCIIWEEKMENQDGLDEQWEKELIHRIDQMEQGNSGIKRMTSKDYIIAGIIVFICLCAVTAGAFIM